MPRYLDRGLTKKQANYFINENIRVYPCAFCNPKTKDGRAHLHFQKMIKFCHNCPEIRELNIEATIDKVIA